MSKTTNGWTIKIFAALFALGIAFITTAWALEDRFDKKLESIQQRTMEDSRRIREMEKTLVRIEGRFNILDERLKKCKIDR